MGGWASAQTCATGYERCYTFELPTTNITGGLGRGWTSQYYLVNLHSMQLEGRTNIDGIPYINTTGTNVFVSVTNSTDGGAGYTWVFPKNSIDNSCGPLVVFTRANCTDGCPASTSKPTGTICLNGTQKINNDPNILYADVSGCEGRQAAYSDFTQYFARRWTFYDEQSGAPFNFTGTNTNMNVFCANFNQFSRNLSTTVTGASMILLTLEQPRFMTTVNALAPRIRQDSVISLIDYYILSKFTDVLMFSVDLQDLTGGQYYKSSIAFRKPINNTMYNVDVQAFDSSNFVYPLLQNNTQYAIVLTSADGKSTRNIGPQWISDFPSTSKSVIVTTPDIAPANMRGGNLNMTIVSNYSTSQIACVYSSSSAITLAEFEVYNITSLGQALTYYTNSTSQSGTLAYTATDMNLTYWAKCRITNTGDCVNAQGGYCNIEQLVTFTNQSGLYRGMNLNLTTTTMGLSSSFLYSVIATVIILIIAGIFGAASYGTGGIIATILNAFFVVVGWLVEPWWYVTYLIVLAVLIKWGENRVGVAG
jgi:hypothetical protein